MTSTPGSTIGSRAGACALVAVAHQRAVTHTQAFCGNVVAALGVWAKLTSDPALASALARLPEQVDDGLRVSRAWAAEAGAVEATNAVVFGSGPAWAAALEAALLLKEVSGMPAEGVETREGATSTMMALRPGDLALSLPTRADDALLRRGGGGVRRAWRARLAGPRAHHRGSAARGRQHLPRRRRAERFDRHRTRARCRHAGVDRRLLPRRERPRVSLGLGVIGCGSVFAGPYRGMIASLATAGRVHVSAVYDVDDRKRRGAAEHYGVDPELSGPEAVVSHPEVDIVLVLTSMNEHGPLTKAALEAGRHVLVEKPLATSLDEAAALLELCADGSGTARLRAAHPAQPDVPRHPRGGASG